MRPLRAFQPDHGISLLPMSAAPTDVSVRCSGNGFSLAFILTPGIQGSMYVDMYLGDAPRAADRRNTASREIHAGPITSSGCGRQPAGASYEDAPTQKVMTRPDSWIAVGCPPCLATHRG
jgi:hypothetical protein